MLSTAGRVVVIVVTLGGLGLSMYGASHLEMGLNPNLALPSDSYLIPFFDLQQEYLQVVRPCFIVAACSAVAHDAVGACGARKGKEGKGLRLVGATVGALMTMFVSLQWHCQLWMLKKGAGRCYWMT